MPVNYTIQADVVDIISDSPQASDTFLVDSNVWYWITYPNASNAANPYQVSEYPRYVNSALNARAHVCCTGLSLSELAHLIEDTEREIYELACGAIRQKEYRHNLPAERGRVVAQVQAAWAQVKHLANPIDVTIDDPTTSAALTRFQNQKVDGYDLFILETLARHGLIKIITDDGDFATIPGIQVFTANRNVLNAARAQGRLSTR